MKRNQVFMLLLAGGVLVLALVIMVRSSGENLTDVQPAAESEQSDEFEAAGQAQVAGARAEESENAAALSPTANSIDPSSTQNSEKVAAETHILFYGETCPHCHDVLEWIQEHQIDEILSVQRKEVYSNSTYSQQLQLAAQNCGLDSTGVPFLYTAAKDCLVGTPKITSFLGKEAGLPVE